MAMKNQPCVDSVIWAANHCSHGQQIRQFQSVWQAVSTAKELAAEYPQQGILMAARYLALAANA